MNKNLKYQCVSCKATNFATSSTFWKCDSCGTYFPTFQGMPMLYLESKVGRNDKSVRSHFYNGILGKFYQFLMPLMHLPVRPLAITKKDWAAYFFGVILVFFCFYNFATLLSDFTIMGFEVSFPIQIVSVLFLLLGAYFFATNPHFFYLFLLAVPVKISLNTKRYKAKETFPEVHKKQLNKFLSIPDRKLQVLDISTGTGNSLYRHGWMQLNAEYTGLDLSEVMLAQCQTLLRRNNVSVDLVVGNAVDLPFADNYFDIVTNYGAVNGYSDIKKALAEMSRVTKSGGLILFLDEQMYQGASLIERIYFKKVISSHCTIRHAPVELLPDNVYDVNVEQVYEFYYICTCNKI
jgi:ubiquinone/menaquinone biosynthesis C-methylase UbiE